MDCPGLVVTGTSNGVTPIGVVGLNLPITFTVTPNQWATAQPVNWNITGTSCTNPTDSSNPCGYFTSTTTSTASFEGPSSVPSDSSITIVATSQIDSSLTGTLPMTIAPDVADVNPVSVEVGAGLTQQYTAVVLPEQAPQTINWTCTTSNGPCANFTQDPHISGLAKYTPTAGEECSGGGGCVTVSAIATVDPTGCTVNAKTYPCVPSQTTVVSSRVNGTYAFQFSGYDQNGRAIAVAGTFTASGGSISGILDENAWNGSAFVTTQHTISGGAYTPINGSNVNANNSGMLTLPAGISFPSTYQVVLDAAGDILMTASNGGANGWGVATSSSKNKFNQGTSANFAFGFTGVDSGNNRVGYVGLLATNGVSSVTSGLIDVNDNGSANNSVCSSAPCTVTGSYTYSSSTNLGQLTLSQPKAMTFDFFVGNGTTNSNNPLTLYAISTDNNPAVAGTMTLQDPKITTYNNAALSGNSVSALTGTNGNVALVNGTADGQGDFVGTFDWNNAGTITSVPPPPASKCKSPTVCTFANTYAATNSNTGRYTLQMLGAPNASPAVSAFPFILYATGANQGYLLDQASTAVITGTMNVQAGPKQNLGSFAASQATGTYAVATSTNSVANASACSGLTSCSATMNLLLTSPGSNVFNVTGVENPNGQSINAIYTLQSSGVGTIGPISPATAPNFVLYALTPTEFFMMELDSGVISPILRMEQ